MGQDCFVPSNALVPKLALEEAKEISKEMQPYGPISEVIFKRPVVSWKGEPVIQNRPMPRQNTAFPGLLEARNQGKEDQVVALVRKSLEAWPSMYSALYLGMAEGQKAWQSGDPEAVSPDADWRYYLNRFLESSAATPALAPLRQQAQEMLAGRFHELQQPPLLLPPREYP